MRDISFIAVQSTLEEMAALFLKDWDVNALVIREAKVTMI